MTPTRLVHPYQKLWTARQLYRFNSWDDYAIYNKVTVIEKSWFPCHDLNISWILLLLFFLSQRSVDNVLSNESGKKIDASIYFVPVSAMLLLTFLTLFIAIASAFPPSKEPIEVRNAVLVVDPRDLSIAEIIVDWRLPKYGSAAAHTRIRTKNARPGEMPSGVSYLLLVYGERISIKQCLHLIVWREKDFLFSTRSKNLIMLYRLNCEEFVWPSFKWKKKANHDLRCYCLPSFQAQKYNVYPFTYFIATAELPIPKAIPYDDIPPELTIEDNPGLLQPLTNAYAERRRYLKLRFGETHGKFHLTEPIKLKVRASFNEYEL